MYPNALFTFPILACSITFGEFLPLYYWIYQLVSPTFVQANQNAYCYFPHSFSSWIPRYHTPNKYPENYPRLLILFTFHWKQLCTELIRNDTAILPSLYPTMKSSASFVKQSLSRFVPHTPHSHKWLHLLIGRYTFCSKTK